MDMLLIVLTEGAVAIESWWIDGLFAVPPGMKWHMGLGVGMAYGLLSTDKIA